LVGQSKWDLDTPALLIDLAVMDANIKRMADYFAQRPCNLRPQTKTHKCPEIALRQLAAGAAGITCAKVGEAEAMADAGIRDILVANQVVGPLKAERLAALAKRCDIIVAVDDAANVREIAQAAARRGRLVGLLIEVNVGMNRCGVLGPEQAGAVAREIDKHRNVKLRGVMGYEGHTVFLTNPQEKQAAVKAAMDGLLAARDALVAAGFEVEIVSAGGTGTYNITGDLPGITELQAGSYVVMDSKYRQVTPEFECALFVLATVISRPTPGRIILDCGRKAISMDFGMPLVVGRDHAEVAKLSEEHAIIEAAEASDLKPADKVMLLPSHCCCTINMYDRFYAVRGDTVEYVWPISGRGKHT